MSTDECGLYYSVAVNHGMHLIVQNGSGNFSHQHCDQKFRPKKPESSEKSNFNDRGNEIWPKWKNEIVNSEVLDVRV